MRADVAEANELDTMTDFGRYVAGGGDDQARRLRRVRLLASRPAGLRRTYGFALKPDQLVILSGGDTAATIAAAARGTSGANAAMVLRYRRRPRRRRARRAGRRPGVQPVYQPAPMVRAEVLRAHPEIAAILDPSSPARPGTLQELNGRIQVGGEPASAVAADFLQRNGFVR